VYLVELHIYFSLQLLRTFIALLYLKHKSVW
jgi:hypothetical protein